MNNFNYGYQPQFTSNKIYVANVDDAVTRLASFNTIMAYFLQDESGIVEVTTEMYGKKYPKIIPFAKQEATKQPTDFITRAEFDDFRSKLDGLTTKKKAVKENDAE